MFNNAEKADPDVSNWDTSQVTNMQGVFAQTLVANPDVSGWDTSYLISDNDESDVLEVVFGKSRCE